jgi:phosphoribosylglycinamide formyltransferase-1
MLKKIGVLVSGGGTNLQSIINAVEEGTLSATVSVVISNKPGVGALERASKHHIPSVIIDHRDFPSVADFTEAVLDTLNEYQVDLVCLAGFLRILDPIFFETYHHRVLNIHPALLPAFGGKGMYGHHVHEAVLRSGTKYSGATVHIVTAETDVGPIVLQGIIDVSDEDTPDSLAAKVLQVEHRIYPEAVQLILEERVIIEGLRVKRRV